MMPTKKSYEQTFQKATQELVGSDIVCDEDFMEDLYVEFELNNNRVEALVDVCLRRGYIWSDEKEKFVKDEDEDEENDDD